MYDAGAAPGGSGGEDIKFDADGMDQVLKQVADLVAQHVTPTWHTANDYVNNVLKPPDHPSGDQYVSQAKQAGQRYLKFNKELSEVLTNYGKKLQHLKAQYENHEADLKWGFEKGEKGMDA